MTATTLTDPPADEAPAARPPADDTPPPQPPTPAAAAAARPDEPDDYSTSVLSSVDPGELPPDADDPGDDPAADESDEVLPGAGGPAAGPTPAPAGPPAHLPVPPDPAAWQDELVELLAGIEHVRWALVGLPLATGTSALLSFAEGTQQACEELAERTAFAPHTADAQAEAVAKAGAFVTHLAPLRPAQPAGGLFRSVLAAFTHDAPPPPDPAAVLDCLLAHHEALNAYFALFTDHFGSSRAARGWVEAATGFLTDYRAMLRDLQ